MRHHAADQFCRRTRREFLWESGAGFGALGLTGLLAHDRLLANTGAASVEGKAVTKFSNPMAPKKPMLPAKAKAVIFLFMYGGPSQVDTFDEKPELAKRDGQMIETDTFGRGGRKRGGRAVGPKFAFKNYGKCGKRVSDLFPHVGSCVDDIAFLHSMYAESPIHGSGLMMMNSGRLLSGSPCLGSWVTYGLGSENENLPGFCVMLDKSGGPINGPQNWSSGYMPAAYQGVQFRADKTPIHDLALPEGTTRAQQRDLLDRLKEKNEEHMASRADNSDLMARIASYELAFKMQEHAPEAVDFAKETEETKALYGIGEARTDDFGRKCLLARRLVERGVRFIQIYSGGNHNDHNWDAHGDLVKNHSLHAGNTDKPIAGLLKDLKRRGLLDSTIVIWSGEFGRQPTAEYAEGTGRDHNAYGFTSWLAGGGIRGGISVGKTDEFGNKAVEDRFHVKNLHATVLQQMGLDPNKLSYFYGGLDQKLVGVEGAEPIKQLI
ncbi:protein containing duf1501 : Putative uncharacterized protein OS=uncultured Acidobacteria bacterium A2 PE=4 SV=1: DUF1501 [Gemmataceae bacterium]|nr:protein containing duf1501 : Putative uncharacterized protein OS=uncultured Acidobacteria bacterium A2 PE=4 SV=1: DUF1501 [Gemmataceae bacterium]VTT97293.1 protein containing duf1501 : Putative uncharacterized protein OS=uncultured Acidobacteria bacterium A2 PE=4 SV=1: DUF1501 [Gemmataceae bacterium]